MPVGELGLALAVLRVIRGWNQKELAKASGLHSNAVSDYERGRTTPELKTLERIVTAMGYPLGAVDHTRALLRWLGSQSGAQAGTHTSSLHLAPLSDAGGDAHQLASDLAEDVYRLAMAILERRSLPRHPMKDERKKERAHAP